MFQTTFFTMLGAVLGVAGSIALTFFVKNIQAEIQLAVAAFLGAVCSSVLVCREKSIQRKLGKDAEGKKKGPLAKLKVALFWLMLIAGLAAVVVAGLKIGGQL